MPHESNTELRRQLEAAIAAVKAQIAVQLTADHYVGSEGIADEAVAELREELDRLEDALADLP